MSSMQTQAGPLRSVVLPMVVGGAALAIAFAGATLVGNDGGIDGVNSFVEGLSGGSSSFVGGLGILAPLGFAFIAGVAAAFNPRGFAMLPAYMGLYMGAGDPDDAGQGLLSHLGRALVVGGAVTAGFVVLFGLAGTLIGVGARSAVAGILPYLGLGIGIVLTLVGAWLLSGGKLYTALAQLAAAHTGDPGQANVRGYFLFGLSYGTASLSCTLSIFLSVVGTSFAVSSISTSLGQFVLYGAGMGMVMIGLTLGMAVFKGAMIGRLRRALPYIQPVGTWMMILAGSYIVFYWLTIGGLL